MQPSISDFVQELQLKRSAKSLDEAATKQAIILRILSLLGWNTYDIDEVKPEYSVGSQKVDYSLRCSDANKVFIEVKKISEELEKHQEQLLNYSFKEGVKLAILTNGIAWWFYLPLNEGSWEQRKFFSIQIDEQKPDEIADRFLDFLNKQNVASGKAVEKAESVYRSNQKESVMLDAMPNAWKKLISEPDDLLIELIADATEKLCGYKPDNTTVEEFISNTLRQPQDKSEQAKPVFRQYRGIVSKSADNYTGKSPVAFTFLGDSHPVKFWIDVIIKLTDILNSRHPSDFNKVLSLKGRKRPYFTTNKNELRSPCQIPGTNISMETNLSANQIVHTCTLMIMLFGYSEDNFMVQVKEKPSV